MNFIWFLLIGLIAGALAKAIMPGSRNEPSGWIMTILLGIVGAFIGGFLPIGGGLVMNIIAATVGAIILIAIMRLVTGNRAVA